MKARVREAIDAKKIERINQQEGDAITFALAIACQVLREYQGFGQRRLQSFLNGTWFELRDQFYKYRDNDEEELSPEVVPTLFVGLRNQVDPLQINMRGVEAETMPDRDFSGWRKPTDREKRAHRWQLLQDRENTFRSIWYAMILYLWRTYGWGAVRLNRFYRGCRERYGAWCGLYLKCRPEYDDRCQKESKKVSDEISSLGVKL